MSFQRFTAVAVFALASFSNAAKGVEKPAEPAILGTDTVAGCFSSLADMVKQYSAEYNTQGKCAIACRGINMPVGATYAKVCYCGTLLPNHNTLLNDTKCNEPCPGFDAEACGGLNAYTVYNTGVHVSVGEAEDDTTTTSSTAPASTSTTAPAQTSSSTKVSTTPAPDIQVPKPKSGSSNKVGIAVGVVVGVLVVAAIAGGLFFYMRRKRNAELEEEHRRNAAVNAFISGGKPPSSSGGMSMADSRMDPVLNRRLSDGSIADNQDYSRRILRVTNA